MKTLTFFKSILLIVVLASTSVVALANDPIETRNEVQNTQNLKEIIGDIIQKDISSNENYFYQNNIKEANENVELKFYITSDKKVKVISSDSKNPMVAKYVNQLLQDCAVDVDNKLVNRGFVIGLKVIYRS